MNPSPKRNDDCDHRDNQRKDRNGHNDQRDQRRNWDPPKNPANTGKVNENDMSCVNIHSLYNSLKIVLLKLSLNSNFRLW